MSKQKMLQAKQFIQQKRYRDAQRILKTIDHPTAKDWLRKVDAIKRKEDAKRAKRRFLGLVVTLSLMLLCAFALYPFGEEGANSPTATPIKQCPEQVDLVWGCLEETMRRVVSGYGTIDEREISTEIDGNRNVRMIAYYWVDLKRGSGENEADQLLGQMLRSYAQVLPDTRTGQLHIIAAWRENNIQCSIGIGMGHNMIDDINWNWEDINSIRRKLDKRRYNDNSDVFDVAFVTGVSEFCR